jgi:hypothetical protein
VQKIHLADWADFAIAEEARQCERTETFLNQPCIVIRVSEKITATAIACE